MLEHVHHFILESFILNKFVIISPMPGSSGGSIDSYLMNKIPCNKLTLSTPSDEYDDNDGKQDDERHQNSDDDANVLVVEAVVHLRLTVFVRSFCSRGE